MKKKKLNPIAQNRETFKVCKNIGIFDYVQIQQKYITYLPVLSDQINLIPFHEQSASHGTSLEYHQQGNRNKLENPLS